MKKFMVITGDSIEDLEEGLLALKRTLMSGAKCGVGASSMEELMLGMRNIHQMHNEQEILAYHESNSCKCGGNCKCHR